MIFLSSFELLKKEASTVPSLAHPVPDSPLFLTVDASDSAFLQHTVNNLTQAMAFFPRQLKPAVHWYTTFDHDLLVI